MQPDADIEPTGGDFEPNQVKSALFYKPTGEDQMAIWVQKTFSIHRAWRKRFDLYWDRYIDLYAGNHWPQMYDRADFWKARIVVNYTRAIIQTIVATVMDSDPKICVQAGDPLQQAYAGTLEACLDSIWMRCNANVEVKDAQTDACTVGTGYLIGYFDPDAENGLGDVLIKSLPPECVYPQPGCQQVSDCKVFFIMRRESRAWIERYWPDKVHLCRPGAGGDLGDMEQKRQVANYQGAGGMAFIDSPVGGIGGEYGGDDPQIADKTNFSNPPYAYGYAQEPLYDVIEFYVEDRSLEVVTETYVVSELHYDMWGTPHVVDKEHERTFERPRYESGWRHGFVNGRTTLEDKNSDFPGIPVAKVVDEAVPHEWFGTGEPQTLEPLQVELNKARSQMIDHARLNGGAVWLVDKAAGIQNDDLDNRPGLIVRYNRTNGQELKREPGVPMPSFMMELVEIAIRDMREVSGVSAQASGQPPKGVRSGAGFESATNIATLRIHPRTHNLEVALRDIGRITIKLVQRNYTSVRLIRVLGNDGFTNFIPFNGANIRGDWDLMVMPGSTMGQTQEAEKQTAMELFKLGVIDDVELLQKLKYRGWEAILKRKHAADLAKASGQPVPETTAKPNYPGWPGMVDRDSTDTTGYSASIRRSVPQLMPPAPAPGGSMAPQRPMAAPIGGNPHFHGKQQ
jgi:hypothetical protein